MNTLEDIQPRAIVSVMRLHEDGYLPNLGRALAYVIATNTALKSGVNLIKWLTAKCPECGEHPGSNEWDHVVIAGHVVIGCEGYEVISPVAVGLVKEEDAKWDDWTDPIIDDERTRTRVVHGWAFRSLSLEDKNGIRAYLATGNPATLPDSYGRLRLAIFS